MLTTAEDLFHHFLRDIFYAERQILKALPKMARAATSPELKKALTEHREETEGHVERLHKVFDHIGKPARGKTCEAIVGLVAEGEEVIESTQEGPVRDAGIIAAAQAVEHYEMARYGALAAWAKEAGRKEVAQLLEETLDEEKKADTLLNTLAAKSVNRAAKHAA
ncbi:MAG: YciE/YciF ferroxidase family protein [Acidiphilium sp.]